MKLLLAPHDLRPEFNRRGVLEKPRFEMFEEYAQAAIRLHGGGTYVQGGSIPQAIAPPKAEAGQAASAEASLASGRVTDAKKFALLEVKLAAAKQAVRNVSNLATSGRIGGEGQVSTGTKLGLVILGICAADTEEVVQQALELSK